MILGIAVADYRHLFSLKTTTKLAVIYKLPRESLVERTRAA